MCTRGCHEIRVNGVRERGEQLGELRRVCIHLLYDGPGMIRYGE